MIRMPGQTIVNNRGTRNITEKTGKGCGIGCALAIDSCEGVDSVDTRTVAAPDVITAFAIPNPGCSSQGSRFFRVWWFDELPR